MCGGRGVVFIVHPLEELNWEDNIMKKNQLLSELVRRQLVDVPHSKKLQYSDIKRMTKYLNGTIFDEKVCSLWTGYITNATNVEKGIYINFYFKGKKAILHRLLYSNFVGGLDDSEYLKFTCANKGKCCNVHHLQKFEYVKKKNAIVDVKQEKKVVKKDGPSLVVKFD